VAETVDTLWAQPALSFVVQLSGSRAQQCRIELRISYRPILADRPSTC